MPEHSLTLGHRQTCRERTDKLRRLDSEVASSVQFERFFIRGSPGVYCGGACAKMKILAYCWPPLPLYDKFRTALSHLGNAAQVCSVDTLIR